MTRFNRLEIEPARKPIGPTEIAAPIRNVTPDPDHDERHWLKLAVQERQKGQFENALRWYSRALEWDKSVVAGWIGQVQMLIALEEFPEAEVWARKALEMFKNNADLLAGRAQALCRIGDLKNALVASDASINQQGNGSYPWLVRAELMLAKHDRSEEFCFDKAVQLDKDWLLPLEIGGVYLHYNKPARALMRIHHAVERAPDQAFAWYRQGQCETLLGLKGPARVSFQRCLQLIPNHVEARRALDQIGGKNPVRRFFRNWFKSS